MNESKSVAYIIIFASAAFILAWGVWKNYRPQIIYAGCSDIAYKTTSFSKRRDIGTNPDFEYNNNYQTCINEAGL